MKILVIGAGYIGLALMSEWSAATFDATTTTKERLPELEAICNHVHLIEESRDIGKWINDYDAAVIAVAPKKGASYEEAYLKTAKAVAEGCTTSIPIVYISSTSVYGEQEGEWVDETTPCNPMTPQSKTLLEAEKALLQSEIFQPVILRASGIYGPGRTLEKRIRYFSGREMEHAGQPTNHIHRDDLVRAIIFSIEKGLEGIYNLAEENHPTRGELYNALCEEAGAPLPIWTSKTSGKKAKVSSNKIQEAGFQFQESIGGKYHDSSIK
jgi:nucleoside-diphosphate-sugar epimerase